MRRPFAAPPCYMKILSFAQLKTAEQSAAENGRSFPELMNTAGNAAARLIAQKYDILGKKINVVCGSGNNGGDGLVAAKALKNMGADVILTAPLGLPSTITASEFLYIAQTLPFSAAPIEDADITIDALFGIGLNRPLCDAAAKTVIQMNAARGIKAALDIPSGVYCDGGVSDIAFKADFTVTFIAHKVSEMLPYSSSYYGDTVLCDLGIIPEEYSFLTIEKPLSVKRDKNAHKGTFGTAFLICGSYGMCGAEILAAKSALKSGVGIVKAVVCDMNYSAFTASLPEAVTIPVETSSGGTPVVYDKTLLSGLSSSRACLIGCGLGKTDEAVKLVKRTLEISEIPTVIDADGINAAAKDINIIRRTKAPLIFTPHPAEMARLLSTTVDDIEHNRIRYAKTFAEEMNCVLVLKGANTIVAAPDGSVYFNTTGNPGMATAGSGDVLSGIITARLAMGYSPLKAALDGVYIHGAAGDAAAKACGQTYMTASDIITGLKELRI